MSKFVHTDQLKMSNSSSTLIFISIRIWERPKRSQKLYQKFHSHGSGSIPRLLRVLYSLTRSLRVVYGLEGHLIIKYNVQIRMIFVSSTMLVFRASLTCEVPNTTRTYHLQYLLNPNLIDFFVLVQYFLSAVTTSDVAPHGVDNFRQFQVAYVCTGAVKYSLHWAPI